MIEPFVIRQRLFLALEVPPNLVGLLHVWAVVEGRPFGHSFMGEMLCFDRNASETAISLGVTRRLNALRAFLKICPYQIGEIKRGGGKAKTVTRYGSFALNRCVSWIQEQLTADPDTVNPIVAVDRYVDEAIRRHLFKTPQPKKEKKTPKSGVCGVSRLKSSITFDRLLHLPNSTFESALIQARFGFNIFPVWGIVDGVCLCRRGAECPDPGKHPILKGWQQFAARYGRSESSLARVWDRHPLANIGIATGLRWANGEFLTVLDCDIRSFGHGTLANLERVEICPLPATREHSRPHKFFTHRRVFHSQPGALGAGLDVQSSGKFVVGVGSTHKSGELYTLSVALPIAGLPDPWADRIDAVTHKQLPMIREGGRRAFLVRVAGALVGAGMDGALALETLKDRRDKRCERGSHWFSDDDLRKMITYCVEQEQGKAVQAAA